jgi:hypothetical protein
MPKRKYPLTSEDPEKTEADSSTDSDTVYVPETHASKSLEIGVQQLFVEATLPESQQINKPDDSELEEGEI